MPFRCEGTLEADLDIGGEIRRASTGYGVHLNFFSLVYVIREEDYDPDGISVVPGSLELVEGVCHNPDGSPVWDIRFAGPLPTNDPDLKVDGSVGIAATGSVSVVRPAVGGAFVNGEPIVVRVAFDRPVVVEGLPRLALRVGGELRYATLDQVERSVAQFRYRVAPGDIDSNGITLPNPLRLVGGTIRESGGGLVQLEVPPTHDRYAYRVRGDAGDVRAPTVAEVTVKAWRDRWPVRSDGTLRQNDRLEVRVAFDEYIAVEDTPTLGIGIGSTTRHLPLSRVEGSDLHFEYVIRAGDLDGDGITIARDALTLARGAAIRDGAANVARLDLGRHAVRSGASYRVRGGGNDRRPTILSADFVQFTPRHGLRGVGAAEPIVFVVRYDEPVWVDTARGRPVAVVRLGAETREFEFLDPGGQRHLRRQLAFAYVVQPSDALPLRAGPVEADYSAGAIRLHGARIQDRAGNAADLTWPAGFNQHWWRVDGSLQTPLTPEADLATLPVTGFLGNRGPDRSFGRHETIDIPLHFSEPVSVEGAPTLELRIGDGDEPRQAAYVGGDGGRRLVFRYRVRQEDLGPLRLPATRIALGAGSLRGAAGHPVSLLVGGVPVPDAFGHGYFVNGGREPDTAVPPVAAPTGVSIASGPGELVVSWEALDGHLSGGPPLTGYVVRARPVEGGAELSCVAAAGETRCVIDGPLDATAFSVTVQATNVLGTGYASTAIVASTEPLGGFWRGWRKVLPQLRADETGPNGLRP